MTEDAKSSPVILLFTGENTKRIRRRLLKPLSLVREFAKGFFYYFHIDYCQKLSRYDIIPVDTGWLRKRCSG